MCTSPCTPQQCLQCPWYKTYLRAFHRKHRVQGRDCGCSNWVHKTRTDSSIITLSDGQKIEYHPSFNFPPHIFQKMKKGDKDKLVRERAEFRNKCKASEMSTV